MNIKGLMHASIFCKNIDDMRSFYEKILGFPIKMLIRNYAYGNQKESPYYEAARKDPNGICIVYFEISESQFIECIVINKCLKERKNWKAYYGLSHIAFTVEDIFKIKEELERKDVVIDSVPKIGNSGTWQMWIHDPEGNPIEIMQFTENSFQLKGHIDDEKQM